MKLAGKIAIVVGAGRGIGQAITLALSSQGADVAAVSRTPSEINETAIAVRAMGRRSIAITIDASDPAAVDNMMRGVLDEFGRVDILVNSAGVYGPIGPAVGVDPMQWLRSIEINLGAAFLCSRAVLPSMIERRRGKIINLAGGGATRGRANFSAYAAAKAAVVRLTETLAEEVRSYQIDINAIAPGGVRTRLIDDVIRAGEAAGTVALDEAKRLIGGQGVSREEVAQLAVFLASDESNGLTGRLISVLWDDWRTLSARISEISSTDLYTLRRVVPYNVQ